MTEFSNYRQLWKQNGEPAATTSEYPGWHETGLAVMGDFSGIQTFLFKPVPGAGGAARRLRSRSFRVSAYSEMVMRLCAQKLSQGQPKVLYSAGGKFVIGIRFFEDCEAIVRQLQTELDIWAWRNFNGELVFHLSSAKFDSGKVPHSGLRMAMAEKRNHPLAGALLSAGEWAKDEFFVRAKHDSGRCDACGATRQLQTNEESEELCNGCIEDEALGKKIPRSRFAFVSPAAQGDITTVGMNMQLCEGKTDRTDGNWLAFEHGTDGTPSWHLLRHLPTERGITLDFDQIAEFAPGSRKWLGYLRIDGDGAGKHFADLEGSPIRTWALSRLMNLFFADTANRLLKESFKNVYPGYGGGDDLFVIGPWTETLDFALKLRQELKCELGDDLSFSAGGALAKPREHVLTQANLAHRELDSAKRIPGHGRSCGRDQIRALGVTTDWGVFSDLLRIAKQVTAWVESKELPNSFLHQLLQLHKSWKLSHKNWEGTATARQVRHKPLLHYQIHRNLKRGDAYNWACSLLQETSQWPRADFIARYAMLAAQRGQE